MKILPRILLCSLLGLSPLKADEALPLPETGAELKVVLEDLLRTSADGPGRVLELDFHRLGDHWFMGAGWSPSYNRGTHRGVVVPSEEGSLDKLKLYVDIQGDAWVRGGFVELEIEWEAGEDGHFQGSYSGKAFDEDASGVARGVYHPAAESLPGFSLANRAEHPRLLLRSDDLPALREKAETDFGKEALARFEESSIGLGLLYLLREDPAYAERAMEAVKVHMADMESGDKSIRHRFWGYRMEQVAITYDLCYHAWPEDFRAEVQQYIRRLARRMHRERGSWTQYVRWNPDNAYNAAMIYSGVIGMLAIADLAGDAPSAPAAPEVDPLAPREWSWDLEVPVVAVESGIMPAKIWYSGPITGEAFGAFREAGGDPTVLELDKELVRVLERDTDVRGIVKSGHTGNQYSLCVNRASDTAFDSWNIFVARWQVEEEGNYLYRSHHGGVVPYMNGERVGNSTLLHLQPGEYSLVLAAPMGRPNPWAGVFVRPTLTLMTDEEVSEFQAEKNQSYAQDMIFYRQAKADWEKLGGVSPAISSLLRDALFWFRTYESGKFGAAGSQQGSTNTLALEGPALMATIYRNVTGQPLARPNGISYWLPRKLMAYSWTEEGEEVHQDFLTRADFTTQGFQDERDNRGLVLASLFPLIAPEYQSMAWWFWQQAGNPLEAGSVPQATRLINAGHPGTSYNSIPVYAFLHAPLEKEAQHPGKVLPKSWKDPLTGEFLFRNGWKDESDVVLQTTAQQQFNRAGSNTTGSFALRGLGHHWTSDQVVSSVSVGGRLEQPVVLTMNPAQNTEGTGRVLEAKTYADGSGVVRMDLTEAYRHRIQDGDDFRETRDNTGVFYPDALVDDGGEISALRSILVDYRGVAGVPAVVIIKDELQGVEDHFWSWPLSIDTTNRRMDRGSERPLERVEIEQPDHVHLYEDGFALRHGDAQLRTRFISGEDLDVSLRGLQNIRRVVHSTFQIRTRNLITVKGGDNYLAVLTLGEGEAPAIATEQDGDSVRIIIGEATYVLENGVLRFEDRDDEIAFPPLH